jgi:6-phosphofructokinase 2
VIKTLGGNTVPVFTAGSLTGQLFRQMVDEQRLVTRVVPIHGETRVSSTIFERSSGHEYRITPVGPELTEAEWNACLDAIADVNADYVVATGSLPQGVPHDFYAQVARAAKERGAKVILDTSGMALFETLNEGVHMVKPNQRELEHLVGRKASTLDEQEALCTQLVQEGKAEIVALTLGGDGAVLAWEGGTRHLPSPKVDVLSAVGAGDSFVAGMTLGLAQDRPLEEAFALGVATGVATVLTAGTELCHREDVERLFAEVTGKSLIL